MPIAGWIDGAISWHWRSQPIAWYIDSQLEQRPNVDDGWWPGDSQRRTFARWLSGVIANEIGWVNDRFVEADPVEVIGWAHDDGLDFEFVVQQIEAKIGRSLATQEVAHLFTLRLGAAVDFLLSLGVDRETGCSRP